MTKIENIISDEAIRKIKDADYAITKLEKSIAKTVVAFRELNEQMELNKELK